MREQNTIWFTVPIMPDEKVTSCGKGSHVDGYQLVFVTE